jgi:hypothetical protein
MKHVEVSKVMKLLTEEPAAGSWYYIRAFYKYHTNWIIAKVLKIDTEANTTVVREYIDLAKFIKHPRTEKLANHATYWTAQECYVLNRRIALKDIFKHSDRLNTEGR